MANVFDVARYILRKEGSMTAMKLQKLVYYSQAWALVWDEKPIFKNKIEAWANGPVCPRLYDFHRRRFCVGPDDLSGMGKANNLTKDERETVDSVLKHYGHRSSQYLSDLTHSERPWLEAREGLSAGERGNVEITHAAMAEYYESL